MTGLQVMSLYSNHDNTNKMAATSGVARSISFASRTSGSSSGSGGANTMVLGEGYRHSPAAPRKTGGSLGFSFRRTPKLPKVPRPTRAFIIFASVKRGLWECIDATTKDITQLRLSEDFNTASSTGQGRLIEYEKQVKAAERYKKRLEFHFAKVEELEENYALQQQLREGVKNMAKAYVAQPGNHQKESLLNVKCGYKECTRTMCAIEAQLEMMLGTFHCNMKGMAGFARLAPGDVFQVTVGYGQQKWKSKGRIGVNRQTWDSDYMVFKALLADVFAIKAVELRSLGRVILLGQKNCETKDLFSSHPQMMTVNINTNGSLKLSVIITWNPLEGVEENMCFYEPPPKSQTAPRRRLTVQSDHHLNGDIGGSRTVEMRSRTLSQNPAHKDSRLSVPSVSGENFHRTGHLRPNSVAIMSGSVSGSSGADSLDLQRQKPRLFDMRLLSEVVEDAGSSARHLEGTSVEEATTTVMAILEDFRGQYIELQNLEEQIIDLNRLLQERHYGVDGTRPDTVDVSISIENALGAFDFLESEDYVDYSISSNSRHGSRHGSVHCSRHPSSDDLEKQSALSPQSTTRTADSGIESLGNRMNDEVEEDLASSPDPAMSTGNEQVDHALLWHLTYCERLLENLGNYGPLKCREIYSLEKLRKQADLIEHLLQLARAGSHITDLHSVLQDLTEKKDVRHFWMRCVDAPLLYTSAERFLAQLEQSFGDKVRHRYDVPATKVFRQLVARILDIQSFDPETTHMHAYVTLHQMASFFMDEKSESSEGISYTHIRDMDEYVQKLAGELLISSRLRSGDTDIVIKTVLSFRNTLPPAECLRVAALLLITSDKEVHNTVSYYMKSLAGNQELRDKTLIVFVEALEDRSADVRCAACIAIRLLNGTESLEQLVYMCQTDPSPMVRSKAKEALLSFGDEGRKAYEQSELTSHGFQGIQVQL